MNEQELQDLQKMLEIAVSALEDVKAKDIAGDLVVHVMLPAVRDYYDIDTLWGGEKPSFHPGAAKPWHAADSQS